MEKASYDRTVIEWGSGRCWPVVGIDGAVGEIHRVIERHEVRGVVLTGPAGVGKSALARAVLARVAAADVVTAHAVADASVSAADASIVDAVRARLGDPVTGTRLVLAVDDATRLDRRSADELLGLVRAGQLFLVATARAGQALPAPLDGALVDGTLTSRTIEPLDRDRLGRAVTGFLGGPIAPEALDLVHGLSGGVPLHARELVQVNLHRGALASSEGRWRFVRPVEAPPTLVDLVASRFVQLDDDGRRSFDALCLAQPVTLAQAEELVGIDLLGRLEDGGLVEVVVEGSTDVIRLAHPLLDQVVRTTMGSIRRRSAAARAADALEAGGRRAGETADADASLRSARLRLEHGLSIPPDLALAAARRALTLADPELAAQLVRTIAAGGFERDLLLGNALSAQGRHDAADAAFHEAVAGAVDDEQRARALSRRGNNLGTGAGDFERALATMSAGLTTIADPAWRSFVEAELAYASSWIGAATGSEATPRLEADQRGPAVPATVRASECLVGAVVAVMAGELDRASAFVQEGLPLVSSIQRDVPSARELLQLSHLLALAFRGDRGAAASVVAVELERALVTSAGAPGIWLAVRAMQGLFDGDLRRTVADATDAEQRLELVDVAGLRPFAQAIRSVAHAQLGEIAASTASAAGVAPGWRDEVKVQTLLTQAVAWQEVGAGRPEAAAEELRRAAEVAFDADHVPMGALAAYDAVRIGHPRAVHDLLAAAVERWEGPLARALLAHAVALIERDADALLDVARRLPGLGCTIGGAEAAMQAARRYEALGRVDEARRAEYAAAATVAPVGSRTSPTLGRPRGLTAREQEVAEAAAAGRSSRVIADELGVSIRTVQNHLAAVYRKLGVAGRIELTQALDPAEPVRPGP